MFTAFMTFLARSLQIVGLSTITYVVLLFFGETEMKTLLNFTIAGVIEFYGGHTLLLFLNRKI